MSLTPSVEVGLRHDGGMDVGAGLIVSDTSIGLAVDVRVRMLLVHQAEGFRERGLSIAVSYAPTPSTSLGVRATVTPSWGGQADSGTQALWSQETMAGVAAGGPAAGSRLETELGYGLPVGSRLIGTPRVGIGASETGRAYRLGYGLTVAQGGALHVELGVDAHRRESPRQGGVDTGGARPGRAGLVRRRAGSGRGVQVDDAGMPIASPAQTWMSAPPARCPIGRSSPLEPATSPRLE